jgi:succinate dehydrogenase flavin-adding protein (antitoxin of CptAB toxin-antitoxin module)
MIKARQLMAPFLEPLRYTALFEQQEQDLYKIITKEEINAKAILNLL